MTHNPSLLHFLQERLVFLLHFLKNPLRNASVMPSSRAAARAMMTGVEWSKTNVIVELGPGTGTFTREVLRLCRPDARIILIELEPKYVKWLREKFGDRIEVIQGSAIDMNKHLAARGIDHADLILSSLPFLSDDISAPLHRDILKHTNSGGLFRFFTYMPPAMKPHYRDLPIRRVAFTEWNLPPMWIFGIN